MAAMEPRLLHRDTWTAPLDALRAGLPAEAVALEFSGTLSRASYGGRETCRRADGTEFHRSRGDGFSGMDVLRTVASYADDTVVGLAVSLTRGGASRVVAYPLPSDVSAGSGSPLGSVVLYPGAIPEPYRRFPTVYPANWDASASPEQVAALVRAALPDAVGMTPQQIQQWERRSNCVLPPDVRALYGAAAHGDLIRPATSDEDEDDDERHLMRILALGGHDEFWRPEGRYLAWEFGATEVVAPDPSGRVQPLAFSPAWVPLGDDWGGNYYVCDLAPGPNGRIGQILFVDHETSSGATWLAPSLTAFLTGPSAGTARQPDPGALSVRIGNHTRTTAADVTAATEVLHINKVDAPVDLRYFAGHPRLRTVVITAGPVIGLEALPRLPALEYLSLDVPTWRALIDRNLLPGRLLAAGFEGQSTWADAVAVANELRRHWERPPIPEHVIV